VAMEGFRHKFAVVPDTVRVWNVSTAASIDITLGDEFSTFRKLLGITVCWFHAVGCPGPEFRTTIWFRKKFHSNYTKMFLNRSLIK
jgi:hypothetical protein